MVLFLSNGICLLSKAYLGRIPFTGVKTNVIGFLMFINGLLSTSVIAYGAYCKLVLLNSGQQFNAGDDQKKKSIGYESMKCITFIIMYFEVKA